MSSTSTSAGAPTRAPGRRAARARRWRTHALVIACQLVLLATLLCAWQWATSTGRASAFLYGSPAGIAAALGRSIADGSLLRDIATTGAETLAGFALGNVLGTTLGLALWYSRFVSRVVQPFILALGSIPIIALAPVVIIWFGTGFASKLAMATLSVVVVSLVISYKGALGVDPDQFNLMRALGATRNQIFRLLVVPASLTDIFAGLKLTVGFALVGAIVGEFMSSQQGLGHEIFKAGSLYAIAQVFAELVATVTLALLLSGLVTRVERWLLPWRHDLN